jgi:hypothetical protein
MFLCCPFFFSPDMVDRSVDTGLLSAICAAEKILLSFDPVADDLASAMSANRRKLMDGTLEAIKNVGLPGRDHFK